MSPGLMARYQQAASEVADHMVLRPDGIAFAPYPMLVETDSEKYAVQRTLEFCARQPVDFRGLFSGGMAVQAPSSFRQAQGDFGPHRRGDEGQWKIPADGLADSRRR